MADMFDTILNEILSSFDDVKEEQFEILMNSESGEDVDLRKLDEVWGAKPYGDGQTYLEHFTTIIGNFSQEEALRMFDMACAGDKNFPECIIKLIADKFPDETKKIIYNILGEDVDQYDWSDTDNEINDKINKYSEALEWFHKFFPEEAAEFALGKFQNCPVSNDALLENFATAIVPFMDEEKLISMIEAEEEYDRKNALMYAVCSEMRRSDGLFMLFKREFKKSGPEHKMDFGFLLSTYGDGRAVPVLRKYAVDLREIWIKAPAGDKEETFRAFSEAKELVEDLGGNVDD